MKLATTALERTAIGVASLALSIALIALLSGFFTARDPASVSGAMGAPGRAFADLGNRPLRGGQPRPAYDSDPPTSGPHLAGRVRRDRAPLTVDQLLSALAAGDVVIAYGTPAPPAGLEALASSIAAPFTPALAAAGQAVILDPRTATHGLVALAWAHLITAARPQDPQLRQFVAFWLGRGAKP